MDQSCNSDFEMKCGIVPVMTCVSGLKKINKEIECKTNLGNIDFL